MITLHVVTDDIKAVAKWGGLLTGSILLIMVFLNFGKIVKEIVNPTPPPPPTVQFGKLPTITFPASLTHTNYTYTLNTLTGTLPSLPDRVKVHKIIPAEPNLLALERAQNRLSRIGFTQSPTQISSTLYEWTQNIPPYRTLAYDILSFNFSITSDYTSDPELSSSILPPPEKAKELAKTFLNAMSSLPEDLDLNKTKTFLYSVQNEKLVPATSLSNAQVIRVDFYQKDINDTSIFYPNPPHSPMNVLIASTRREGQIVEANFLHYNISSPSATYPILTAEEAYKKLQQGEGYISGYTGVDQNISIKDIKLGYYLGEENQTFLMPIVVFEGDDGFFAYINAIREDWLKKND